MARVIWTEPALQDLDAIADYIALDKPEAARKLIEKVFEKIEHLRHFPEMGSVPIELRRLPYRQMVVPPCRIFYRIEKDIVYIICVMRGEQLFRKESLEKRESEI